MKNHGVEISIAGGVEAMVRANRNTFFYSFDSELNSTKYQES